MTRCDVCCRLVPLGPTCASCMAWSWRILGGLGAVVMALTMWGCGGDDMNPLAPTESAAVGSALGPPVASTGEPGATHGMGEVGAGPLRHLPSLSDAPAACTPDPALVDRAERFRAMNDRPPGYAKNWRETLLFFGVDHADNALRPVEPVTVATLRVREGRWSGWRPFRVEAERLLACGWTPPSTTTVTTPEPEPQADAGTAHFVGASPLGLATAEGTPVMAVMGEDDHYGVEFTVARSGSNRVCLDGAGAWQSDEFRFRFNGLDGDHCIEEGQWENGEATVRGFGSAVDNNVVDGDRTLSLQIRATSETTPTGGAFVLTIVNDDWLWVRGGRSGNSFTASLQRPIGDTILVRATMNGPAWTRGPGRRYTRVVHPPGDDPNPFTEITALNTSRQPTNPRDCSRGAAWVDIVVLPADGSKIRQENLKVYNGRYNLC